MARAVKFGWCRIVLPGFLLLHCAAASQEACHTPCEFKSQTVTCSDRVQWSTKFEFTNDPQACSKAYDEVQQQCGAVCKDCQMSELDCGVWMQTTTTPPPNFDCDSGFLRWQEIWTDQKKDWCCLKHGRGCKGLPQDPPEDCSQDKENWEGWSPWKKNFCCGHTGFACEHFDCGSDLASWQTSWSPDKKRWCCETHLAGCTDQAVLVADLTDLKNHQPHEHDCTDWFLHWGLGWAEDKKTWCCAHEQLGCASGDVDQPVNWFMKEGDKVNKVPLGSAKPPPQRPLPTPGQEPWFAPRSLIANWQALPSMLPSGSWSVYSCSAVLIALGVLVTFTSLLVLRRHPKTSPRATSVTREGSDYSQVLENEYNI
mmetsp:Transcript_9997/g.21995  ORF Transcript_9997/g.21995 Transcript_9997/m.21995 type:complete len:369 (-) Transcript_9997:180-1286(-)